MDIRKSCAWTIRKACSLDQVSLRLVSFKFAEPQQVSNMDYIDACIDSDIGERMFSPLFSKGRFISRRRVMPEVLRVDRSVIMEAIS